MTTQTAKKSRVQRPVSSESDHTGLSTLDTQPTREITITLPLCPPDPDSYIAQCQGRINTRLDRGEQLDGLRYLHAGLRQANATLESGRPVDGTADVLRWLFEAISHQLSAVSDQPSASH